VQLSASVQMPASLSWVQLSASVQMPASWVGGLGENDIDCTEPGGQVSDKTHPPISIWL